MPVNRRRFLTRSGAVALSTAAAPSILVRARSPQPAAAPPRHIIHLVADGMNAGTLSCADHLSHLVRGRCLSWLDLYTRADTVSALMDMRSLNSLVTDSSAASSSWGSGSRIANGALNVLPDGRELRPLFSLFADINWKRGLVTTTEITHATPAGFAANDASRNSADNIALQYLERKVDVVLGGGRKFLERSTRKDKRDLWQEFQEAGYTVMRTAADLQGAPRSGRWMGAFASSHLPYTVDHVNSPALLKEVPTLAAMTQAALDRLGHEDHFILQVEGGRVDHAAHGCDAAGAFYDQIAFDEALEVCVAFQKAQPETLVVVTTDHGTGSPCLNGSGTNYSASSPLFANLRNVRASLGEILGKLGKEPSAAKVASVVAEHTGYEVPGRKAAAFAAFLAGENRPLYDGMNSASTQLGQLLGNYLAIGWTGSAHTSDYVPLVAFGPGAERFRGFIRNVDVFKHYVELAGIDFRNPSVPLTAAYSDPAAVEETLHYIESAA